MRFFRIEKQGRARVGVAAGDEGILLPPRYGDVAEIIEQGQAALGEASALLSADGGERVSLASARLLAPIARFPRDILCCGWNYWDHFEEGSRFAGAAAEREAPEAPTFFTKGPDTVIGPLDPIAFDPLLSQEWDYEGEVAVVIGKTGRDISADKAYEHVFGLCLANDVSLRDLQRRHGGQWLKGKSIDATMPIGPMIVTLDELDPRAIQLQCLVNGEIRQDATTAQMAFSIPRLIAELSRGMTLRAGQILLTGTPAGVGCARNPPAHLAEGDEVIVRSPQLGELRNRVTQA